MDFESGVDISFNCLGIDGAHPSFDGEICVSIKGANMEHIVESCSPKDIVKFSDPDDLLDEIGDQRMIDYLVRQGYLVTEE